MFSSSEGDPDSPRRVSNGPEVRLIRNVREVVKDIEEYNVALRHICSQKGFDSKINREYGVYSSEIKKMKTQLANLKVEAEAIFKDPEALATWWNQTCGVADATSMNPITGTNLVRL